ncbi:MAG: BON domain-containing protein [Terriglobales bacterium]
MNTKLSVRVLPMLVVLSLALACQKGASDAQITGQVKSNLSGDAAIAAQPVDVQSQNGVVTLSGTVQTDQQRAAASTDAARVSGVKTVVNNLQVQPQAADNTPPAEQSAAPPPAERPERHPRAVHGHRTERSRPAEEAAPEVAAASTPAQNMPMQSAPAVESTRPATATIPDGTEISVRLNDPLDSGTAQPGQTFRGTLAQAITVDGQTVLPTGADIEGRVVEAKNAAHFSGGSSLTLQLTRMMVNGKSYELQTDQWSRQGTARGKNTAEKVGGGAALGAIIGAIAGGGKGAAIGATVGAGAGTGAQAVTRGQQIHLDPEAVVNFRLTQPLTVTPAARRNRESQP